MLTEKQVGERTATGVRYPAVSAMGTGKVVERGDTLITIGNRFVMVKASEWRPLNDKQRAIMRDQWRLEVEALALSQADAPVGDPPDLEPMTFQELKAQAEREGADITGRRSAEDIRAAIEAHRIRTSFGVTAGAEDPAQEANDGN